MDSELHIIIPGICGPLAETQSIKDSRVVKDWVKVLARSQRSTSSASLYDVTSSILNLSNSGDFPSAALTLLANNLYDSSMHYMHADPVYLRAELDHAVLTPCIDLEITEHESIALCDALNKHFIDDDLSFFRLNKEQWFVSSKDEITVETTPLVAAIGRNVNFILPTGVDSSQWKQLLTESQMLMHTHAVNEERENTNRQIINSLWLHGSGDLPQAREAVSSICSNDDLYNGLSRHLKCVYNKVPASAGLYQDYLLKQGDGSINLLHISELEGLTNYTDVSMWLEKLTEILDDWVYPLIKFCNKNNINVTLYPCNESKYLFDKFDSFKLWRSGAIDEYVTRY